MDHCERLFPKQEGIELAAPRILRRLNCALVPLLCVTIDRGVLPAFSVIISEKKNVKSVTLISQFRNGSDNRPRIYKLKIRSGFSEVTVFWGHGALNINHWVSNPKWEVLSITTEGRKKRQATHRMIRFGCGFRGLSVGQFELGQEG